MKTRSALWSLLILPLVAFAFSCDRTTSSEPVDDRAQLVSDATQEEDRCNPKKMSSIVYALVEIDVAGNRIAEVQPPELYVCRDQNVMWLSSDPDTSIQVFWKRVLEPANGNVPQALPCETATPRCGGAKIDLPAKTRVEYGVRAVRNGTALPDFDPVLEILP